ncbi:glycoside hydrolase family 75 protein [Streptomyces sp. NPDC049915]|uniref:glycoside hydrolase family 75 protein n=1 Tax=Streptomyces sp. NPDC049915 TaxID=3155510 RepID=UPI003446B512
MRVPSMTLAAAGLVLLAPALPSAAAPRPPALPSAAAPLPSAPAPLPSAAAPRPPAAGPHAPVSMRPPGAVRAAELLARARSCAPVSRGRYRTDDDTPPTVPVCGTRDAVIWTADLDIDCDGRPTPRCNGDTDPLFAEATAFAQADGRYPSAETLPYIVVPAPSARWDHRRDGVRGGSVAAVVHRGRVQYAVVGDIGPSDIIGEASYATARALGIRADPHGGGAPSGVTYIVFKDSEVKPIEDRAAVTAVGERLARQFVRGGRGAG